jgi:hypothetical protein
MAGITNDLKNKPFLTLEKLSELESEVESFDVAYNSLVTYWSENYQFQNNHVLLHKYASKEDFEKYLANVESTWKIVHGFSKIAKEYDPENIGMAAQVKIWLNNLMTVEAKAEKLR